AVLEAEAGDVAVRRLIAQAVALGAEPHALEAEAAEDAERAVDGQGQARVHAGGGCLIGGEREAREAALEREAAEALAEREAAVAAVAVTVGGGHELALQHGIAAEAERDVAAGRRRRGGGEEE